jgi:hypothetical protein
MKDRASTATMILKSATKGNHRERSRAGIGCSDLNAD